MIYFRKKTFSFISYFISNLKLITIIIKNYLKKNKMKKSLTQFIFVFSIFGFVTVREDIKHIILILTETIILELFLH